MLTFKFKINILSSSCHKFLTNVQLNGTRRIFNHWACLCGLEAERWEFLGQFEMQCSFLVFLLLCTVEWFAKPLKLYKMHHLEPQGPNRKPLNWFYFNIELRRKYPSHYSMLIGMFRYCQILLIPDVLSNGLNFVLLHGPLVSLHGLKKMITWSQVCSPQELNLLTQVRQCSTFAEWIFTSRRISCPQITLFLNFPLR